MVRIKYFTGDKGIMAGRIAIPSRRRVTVHSSDTSSLPTLDLLERLGREMPEVFE